MNDLTIVERLAKQVAAGESVDWAEAEQGALDERGRQVIAGLGLLARIAAVHGVEQSSDASEGLAFRWRHLRLLEYVTSGAFGDLYRAHDESIGRDVALQLRRVRDSDHAQQELEQVRRFARVRHSAVVTLYGGEYAEGHVGVWMELLDGRSLEEILIESGPRSPVEAVTIGREICRGLAALHGAGLVHGDVHADRVIRERTGRLVLHMPLAASLGSTHGPLDDLRDLGRLIDRLVRESAVLPTGLRTVIDRATEAAPSRRFPTAGAMELALSECLDPPPTASAVMVARLSRRYQLFVAVAAVAASLALGSWVASRPPSFSVGTDQAVEENSGRHVVPGWTTVPEGRHTFATYTLWPALFLEPPHVRPDGTLQYSVATNATGSTVVEVTLTRQDGWLGPVTASAQTFNITITPARHPPSVVDDQFETTANTTLVVGPTTLPGLVHWWRGNGSTRDEVAGGPEGRLLNGTTFVPGFSGDAFGLNGGSDEVRFGTAPGTFGRSDFTIAFLIQTSSSESHDVLSKSGNCGPPNHWGLHVNEGQRGVTPGRIGFSFLGDRLSDFTGATSTRSVTDGEFHSVVAVRAGIAAAMYVDLRFQARNYILGIPSMANAAELRLGSGPCADVLKQGSFRGVVDELALFDRALSDDEIRKVHQHGVLVNDHNRSRALMKASVAESPAHGTVSLSLDGTFRYAPNPGFVGVDQFTYRATNTLGESSSPATVRIVVKPARPGGRP